MKYLLIGLLVVQAFCVRAQADSAQGESRMQIQRDSMLQHFNTARRMLADDPTAALEEARLAAGIAQQFRDSVYIVFSYNIRQQAFYALGQPGAAKAAYQIAASNTHSSSALACTWSHS